MSLAADSLRVIMSAQCVADGMSANTVSELDGLPPELYRPTEAAVQDPVKSVIRLELSTTGRIRQPPSLDLRIPIPAVNAAVVMLTTSERHTD